MYKLPDSLDYSELQKVMEICYQDPRWQHPERAILPLPLDQT